MKRHRPSTCFLFAVLISTMYTFWAGMAAIGNRLDTESKESIDFAIRRMIALGGSDNNLVAALKNMRQTMETESTGPNPHNISALLTNKVNFITNSIWHDVLEHRKVKRSLARVQTKACEEHWNTFYEHALLQVERQLRTCCKIQFLIQGEHSQEQFIRENATMREKDWPYLTAFIILHAYAVQIARTQQLPDDSTQRTDSVRPNSSRQRALTLSCPADLHQLNSPCTADEWNAPQTRPRSRTVSHAGHSRSSRSGRRRSSSRRSTKK